MKKMVFTIMTVLALVLATGIMTVAAQDTTDGEGDAPERKISEQEQLIIGIFELEDTDLAVTAEQAASILPIVESLVEMSQPGQPAERGQGEAAEPAEPAEQPEFEDNSEEITALYEDIKAVLTDEQNQAVEDLELDQDSVSKIMEDLGIKIGEGMGGGQGGPGGGAGEGTSPERTPSAEEIPTTDGEGGNGPGGQGGEAPANGEGGQPDGGRGGASMVSSALLEVLVDLLETK